MDRRAFIGTMAGALLAAPLAAEAQKGGKVPRLGVLVHGRSPTQQSAEPSAFGQGLRDRGWVPGQTILVEALYTEGQADRLPELATELVRRHVDVIWCPGPPPTVAAARVTKTIPIVFSGVAFPVELGLVASLGRPGGNVTGIAYSAGPEILAKLVQLIKEVAPPVARIAAFYGESSAHTVSGEPFRISDLYDHARRQFAVEVRRFALEAGEELDRVLAKVRGWQADAISAYGDPTTWRERQRIVDFANQQRLPGVFGLKDFTLAGGLLSYGPDIPEAIRQSTRHVDRILRGAKPADLPVEQPTKFDLVINLKTAKAIGLTIPSSLLQRADQVIE